MKRRVILMLLAAALVLGIVCYAAAGDPSDPLVSLSFLLGDYRDSLLQRAEKKTVEEIKPLVEGYSQRLGQLVPSVGGTDAPRGYSAVRVQKGQELALDPLCGLVLTAGSGQLSVTSGELLDLTLGTVVANGGTLLPDHRYMTAENAVLVVLPGDSGMDALVEGAYTLREGSAPPVEPAPSGTVEELFADMKGHWGAPYVETLYSLGVVNGVGNGRFAPNDTVTRAMLVTILGRVDGANVSDYTASAFSDVSISQWYGPYVAWAESCGVVNGYEDGTFRPNDPISREQMALIFYRYAAYKHVTIPREDVVLFADAATISPWALDAVDYAHHTGLINGKGGNVFDPRGTATRAEICAVTARFLEKAGLL